MSTAIHVIEKHYWKRLGWVGFAFFLIKGLVWLALPVVLVLTGGAD